jgi:hypothetical protein
MPRFEWSECPLPSDDFKLATRVALVLSSIACLTGDFAIFEKETSNGPATLTLRTDILEKVKKGIPLSTHLVRSRLPQLREMWTKTIRELFSQRTCSFLPERALLMKLYDLNPASIPRALHKEQRSGGSQHAGSPPPTPAKAPLDAPPQEGGGAPPAEAKAEGDLGDSAAPSAVPVPAVVSRPQLAYVPRQLFPSQHKKMAAMLFQKLVEASEAAHTEQPHVLEQLDEIFDTLDEIPLKFARQRQRGGRGHGGAGVTPGLIRRSEEAFAEGRPSAGVSVLTQPRVPLGGNVAADLQALHSKNYATVSEEDLAALYPPPGVGMAPEWTDISGEEVRRVAATLSNSSAGPSRLPPAWLKSALNVEGGLSHTLAMLFNFFMERGWMPRALCRSRLHPIPKAAGGLRPIAISEVLQRLLAKIVAARVLDVTRQRLCPFQLGIGVPDPIAAISAYLGNALHSSAADQPPVWLMKVDIKSAFTMASRDAVFRAIACWGEKIGKWFRYLYDKESLLFFDGDEPAEIISQTGVRQGDPLSSMAFCLVLDPALRAAADVGDRDAPHATAGGISLVPCFGYHDDTYWLSQSKAGLRARYDAFLDVATKINLEFRLPKCWYCCSHGGNAEGDGGHFEIDGQAISYRIPPSAGGMELLGTCIGGSKFCRSHFATLAKDALTTAEALLPLSMQSFLIAIRQCIVPRLMHAIRSSDSLPIDTLGQFDVELRNLICERLSLGPFHSLSNFAKQLISLPIRLGGLGITELAAVGDAAAAGALVSMLSVDSGLPAVIAADLRRMFAGYHAEGPLCDSHVFLGRAVKAFSRLGITPNADFNSFLRADKVLPSRHTQHVLWSAQLEASLEELRATAPPFLQKVLSATVVKESDRIPSPSSAWMTCYPAPIFRLSDRAVRLAVLERLGISDGCDHRDLLEVAHRPGCPLCNKPMVDGHFFECNSVSRFEIKRHDAVTSLLHQMCLKTHAPVVIELTHLVRGDAGRDHLKRPDLTVAWPARVGARDPVPSVRHHLDVVTANVFAATYDRCSRDGSLANQREASKVADYRDFCHAHVGEAFHPFCVTHLGQLGDGAKTFLELIKAQCKEAKVSFALKWWLARLSVSLVRFASWCLDAWTEQAAREVGRRRAAVREPILSMNENAEDVLLTSA